jgi:hypothetical protein
VVFTTRLGGEAEVLQEKDFVAEVDKAVKVHLVIP